MGEWHKAAARGRLGGRGSQWWLPFASHRGPRGALSAGEIKGGRAQGLRAAWAPAGAPPHHQHEGLCPLPPLPKVYSAEPSAEATLSAESLLSLWNTLSLHRTNPN